MSQKEKQEKYNSKKICQLTGKSPSIGRTIVHRGVAKRNGGIGLQRVKCIKRKFRPNLQRVRAKLPSGQIKRIWLSAKALKSGKVVKASRAA